MAKQAIPLRPPEELWDLFALNPLTGELFWRTNPPHTKCKPNRLAGGICTMGYVQVTVKNRKYFAHRIIRAWVDGKDPGETWLDHADRNKHNNQPWNIRPCTFSQNCANINTKQGYYFCSRRNKCRACIGFYKKSLHLGYFDTAEQARNCYIEAKRRLFGEFAP